jgi:voltage-gated potassium channel
VYHAKIFQISTILKVRKMLRELYLCLEEPQEAKFGWMVQLFIFLTIIINISAFSLDTVKSLHTAYGDILSNIEMVTVGIFTVELLTRYLVIGANNNYTGLKGRLKYTFTFYTLVDIIAILPFLLSIFGINTYFIRILRLLRVFKLFRVAKVTIFDEAIHRVLVEEREHLLIIFGFIGIILILLTVMVYYAESTIQPEVFSSIPQTLWWAVVTLSTVGYGDMYPLSVFGRIATSFITMLGIAFYAIPGSLFTAALIREINKEKCNTEN